MSLFRLREGTLTQIRETYPEICRALRPPEKFHADFLLLGFGLLASVLWWATGAFFPGAVLAAGLSLVGWGLRTLGCRLIEGHAANLRATLLLLDELESQRKDPPSC